MKQFVRRLLPQGQRSVRVPLGLARGCRIRADLRQDSLRVVLGLYEYELNSYIRKLCASGTRTFDIGGQIGLEALMFARLSGSQVLSVDADGECCQAIRSNAALNGSVGSLISVRKAFVGNSADDVSLDRLVDETFVPGFVKLDIEGSEADALRGGQQLLSEHRPAFLVEVHGRDVEDECIDILRAHQYHLSTVTPRTWLPDERPMPHNRWVVAEPPR